MRIAFASGEGSSPIVFFRDHAGARKIRASRTVRKYSNPSSGVRAIDTYMSYILSYIVPTTSWYIRRYYNLGDF